MISEELYAECLVDALAEPKLGFESLPPGWLRRQLKKKNMSIKEEIKSLRVEMAELHAQVCARIKRIADLESQCQHSWTEPKLVVQSISHDCGSHGGSYDSRRWERECTNCGKIDTTYREVLMSVPDFGNQDGKISLTL